MNPEYTFSEHMPYQKAILELLCIQFTTSVVLFYFSSIDLFLFRGTAFASFFYSFGWKSTHEYSLSSITCK